MTDSITTPQAHLRQQFAALRGRGLRAKDAARRLGVSEGQAMAAYAVSHMHPAEEARSLYSVTVLGGDWAGLLQGLEAVGPVLALTRNESVLHETIGVYRSVSTPGPMAWVLGADIDLRLLLTHWHVGMHVVERTGGGEQHSLQFFDGHGQAVHQVHAGTQSDLLALEHLVQRHARPEARPLFTPEPALTSTDLPDAQIDARALDQAWSAMKDTHEFHAVLKAHQVGRAQGLRLMEGRHTRRTPLVAVEWLLQRASRSGLPIRVFAGNAGCLQIHTGAVRRIETVGPWLQVLDERFKLHLRADHIAESWLVSKPTGDGVVTSLELFDARGQVIAMVSGERQPGRPERPAWRALAQGLLQPDDVALEAAA